MLGGAIIGISWLAVARVARHDARPRATPLFSRVLIICLLFGPAAVAADSSSRLGGELTSDLPPPLAVQVTAPNVTIPERRELQARGFFPFHRTRTVQEGLGPLFVNASCGGCHVNNGRGPALLSRSTGSLSRMVVKVRPQVQLGDDPSELSGQILDHNSQGQPPVNAKLSWMASYGRYEDGTRYQLRSPKVLLRSKRPLKGHIRASLRMSPPIIGPGLLEAVPWHALLDLSFAPEAKKDGISGRINWVIDSRSGTPSAGRFGFKAAHPTVEQQTAAALYNDMQFTNPLFHDKTAAPEVSESELAELTMYQKLGGVPAAINQDHPQIVRGRTIFFSIGCELCHRSTLHTGDYADPELSNQTFHPYSDLLLHYMGSGLADEVAESGAAGGEWRTTPLWGLHLLPDSSKDSVYLHDGRARTIEEAILWHGGEAARARQRFLRLKKKERDDLIQFLRSL